MSNHRVTSFFSEEKVLTSFSPFLLLLRRPNDIITEQKLQFHKTGRLLKSIKWYHSIVLGITNQTFK